jgi:hypothetical protein
MPWVKLDDKFHSNPKMEAAGNAARGLYCSALSYCGDHLTDGFVTLAWAKKAGTTAERDKLTATHAWRPVKAGAVVAVNVKENVDRKTVEYELDLVAPDDGYVIDDYLTMNPRREKVEKRRRDTADRVAAWKDRQAEQDATANAVTNALGNELLTPPPYPKPVGLKSTSPTGQEKRPTKPPISCPICGLNLPSEQRVIEHLDNVHAILEAEALTLVGART